MEKRGETVLKDALPDCKRQRLLKNHSQRCGTVSSLTHQGRTLVQLSRFGKAGQRKEKKYNSQERASMEKKRRGTTQSLADKGWGGSSYRFSFN